MTSPRSPSDALRARVLAEARGLPSPTRAQHRARALALGAGGVLATLALFFATDGLKPGTRPAELIAFHAVFTLAFALVLTRLSGGAPGNMLGRPRAVLLGAPALAAPALALGAVAAAALWPEVAAADDPSTRTHVACSVLTIVQGALPLAALLVPRRGTDPIHPAVSGAALGMTAGAWAATMAYLRCPHGAASHCVIAHVGPTLLLAAAGAALGALLLRIKR